MAILNFNKEFKGLAAKIEPFKAVFNDTENVTHLRVSVTNDNQVDNASLWWEVLDEKQVKHASGIVILDKEDYVKNNVSKAARFDFVANKLGIKFA